MNRAYHIVDIEGTVRFDRYLRGMFPGITQALIEKLLRKGLILLNDCIVSSSARVKTGDVVGVGDEYIVCCTYLVLITLWMGKRLLHRYKNW